MKRKRGGLKLMDVAAIFIIGCLVALLILDVWSHYRIVIGGACINC
jgi:uncharacterized membrane protein